MLYILRHLPLFYSRPAHPEKSLLALDHGAEVAVCVSVYVCVCVCVCVCEWVGGCGSPGTCAPEHQVNGKSTTARESSATGKLLSLLTWLGKTSGLKQLLPSLKGGSRLGVSVLPRCWHGCCRIGELSGEQRRWMGCGDSGGMVWGRPFLRRPAPQAFGRL